VDEEIGTKSASDGCTYPGRRDPSYIQTIWMWVPRLCLPMLLAVCVKALHWLWIDNVYGTRWLDIVGGTALALGLIPIALWCVCAWLGDSEDREKL
jgi:hypothetical protein